MAQSDDDTNWFEREALHFAAQDGNIARVNELLDAGANINAFDDLSRTPLHYAALAENHALINLLLQLGANVNAHDEPKIGETPLGEIAGNCSLATAKLLVEAGADPTIRGWMQITALDHAAKRKRGDGPAVYKLLLETSNRRIGG